MHFNRKNSNAYAKDEKNNIKRMNYFTEFFKTSTKVIPVTGRGRGAYAPYPSTMRLSIAPNENYTFVMTRDATCADCIPIRGLFSKFQFKHVRKNVGGLHNKEEGPQIVGIFSA